MSILKSSLLMASGTVISRVLGFARSVLLAVAIGVTTNAADAFGVANQLPNNVYVIIVGGVLQAVLVPQIVKARSHEDGGKGYIDRLLTFLLSVFLIVTVVATFAAPILVRVYTSGWNSNQLALATAFAYWCLPQLFFYGLYSVLGEVLNARSAFGPYTWAPVLNNIVALAGLIAYIMMFGSDPTDKQGIQNWTESQIAWLSGSATIGVAAQAIILLFAWKRIGMSLHLNFKWRGFGLGPALKAASWTLGMVIVTQIGGLVQSIVASGATNGRTSGVAIASVAAASIGWLIFMLPHSVATVSIATAYFTKMSQHVHEGRVDLLKSDLAAGLRTIALISAIASATLVVLAYPVARVFVGEYDGTAALGNVLIALMVGLLPFSFVFMMQRAFYALENTRTPFLFTCIQIGLHMCGSITIAFTVPHAYVVMALSALTSFTVTVQAFVAYRMLRRKIGSLFREHILASTARFLVAAIGSGLVGWAVLQLIGGVGRNAFSVHSIASSLVADLVVGAVMAVVYFVLLRLMRAKEAESAIQAVKGILRK